MGHYSVIMKTHNREEITYKYLHRLNPCKFHNHTPRLFRMVVGRRKEIWYVINCDHDDCSKLGSTPTEVIDTWNKWNPKNHL